MCTHVWCIYPQTTPALRAEYQYERGIYGQKLMVLAKMVRTKCHGEKGTDKMVWTQWQGQNVTDKMTRTQWYG